MLNSTLKNSELLMLSRMGVVSALNKLPDIKADSYLPSELSFLEIDNNNIILSALKKSENGDYVIIRIYNISPSLQKVKLSFFKKLSIKNIEIVNFLEDEPKNEIKAKIDKIYLNELTISIEPHVIATIKLEFNTL